MYNPQCIPCKNPKCKKMFEKYRVQKYCSVHCRNQHSYKRNHKPKKGLSLRHCLECGTSFLYGNGHKRLKYCSDTCSDIVNKERTKHKNRKKKPKPPCDGDRPAEKDGIEWSEAPEGDFIKRKPGKFTKRCSVCAVGITDEMNAYYYGHMVICDDECFKVKHPSTKGKTTNRPSTLLEGLFPSGYRGHANGQRNVG